MKESTYRDSIINLYAQSENLSPQDVEILKSLIDIEENASADEIMKIIRKK